MSIALRNPNSVLGLSRQFRSRAAQAFLLAALLAGSNWLHAQGGAFTYQGRLNDRGAPANGSYDLQFALYDAPAAGSAVSGAITNTACRVSNGLFTVVLDFGSGVFTGAPRWLEIGVRTNGPGAFTTLAPRQPLTPTPYALYAPNAGSAAIAASVPAGSITAANLASNAVTSASIAPGAVTALQLAKAPRSGSIPSSSLQIDFGHADFAAGFVPSFNSTPIVTLSVEGSPWFAAKASLFLLFRSASYFAGHLSSPTTPVRVGADGVYPSMTLVNGTPAICWRSGKYVRCSDSYGFNWNAPITVDSAGDAATLLVVNGNPALGYNTYSLAARYVRATDANGATWGAPVTIGTNASSVSMAIVNGNPAMCYYDNATQDLMYARASDANGASWPAPRSLDTAGMVGRNCSLAVINGSPAISYFDLSNNNLKFIRAADADGTAWNAPVVVDSGGGVCTSLADVNGRPAIAYSAGGIVKFVRATDAGGSAWGTPASFDGGGYVSLKVVSGAPAISYISGELKYVRARNADGTSWPTPATVDSTSNTGAGTSLLMVGGAPAIAYCVYSSALPGELRFVREQPVAFTINWIALEP